MKQLRLLKQSLLVVALLCAGVSSSWAQKTSVGTEDNATGWWTDFSDYYTIEPNRSLRLSFTNYSSKSENFHNWVAVVTTDADRGAESGYSEYLVLRADNYGWGSSYSAGTLTNNYNWDTFKDDLDASHVEMTVSRSGATVTVRADITTSTGAQLFEQWVGTCGDGTQNIRVFLTAESAHLTDIAQTSAETNIYYFYQDYEDATDASSWSTPNGVLNLVTGDNTYGKYITLKQSGGGQRSGSTTFNNESYSTLSSYTLEFDYKYSQISDRQNQVVVYTNTFSSPGNNEYYTGNDDLINLQQKSASDNKFMIDNSDTDLVTLEANTWYHISLAVDGVNEKVTTTIKNGNTVILNAHEATKTGINLTFKGIWAVVGRSATVASFDNFVLNGDGTEIITTSVTAASVNLATGSTVLAVSAETNAVTPSIKHYYSSSYLLTDPVEISDGSVELASGTYYFYSVNTASGSKSNSVKFVVDATETVAAPTVSASGSTVTVTSGASNAGSSVTSYAVKYATSEEPATEGTALTEGANTLDQGYYYIYTVSEYGNVSEPVYAEVVCRNKETFAIKSLYDNGYRTINNSGSGDYGYKITSFTNASGEVGRYVNERFQFWYQDGNGNNWWMRDSSRPLFVSSGKSSNFAVKVKANDAVSFSGSSLQFIENSNIYGVTNGNVVTNDKVYFAKEDGYVVILGNAYAVMNNVVVYTNDELMTDLSATKAVSGANRVITVTPAYSTSDAGIKTVYTTDGNDPTAESTEVEDNEITISENCTVKIVTLNTLTGHSSNMVSMDITTGEIILNEPKINLTAMNSTGDFYAPAFTITEDNAALEGAPTAVLTATFAGEEVDITSGTFVPTEIGTLVVTASADGYTSASSELYMLPCYTLAKSADFSEINSKNIAEKLGNNWTVSESSTRWASWSKTEGVNADGTSNGGADYYIASRSSGSTVVYDLMNLDTNGQQLLIGYGFGRNANDNQNSSFSIPNAAVNGIANYVMAQRGPSTKDNYVYQVDNLKYSFKGNTTVKQLYYYVPATVSVPISTYGYATLCPTYNLDFSEAEDIEACKAAVDNTGKITYTVVNTVAAGEGVLLRSKAGGEATEAIPVIASATANEDNAFVGITEKQQLAQTETVDETPYTRYILSVKNDVMGFYKVNTAGSWVSAGTAYLRVASSVEPANARGFYPLWSDETTDIRTTGNTQHSDGSYYNLQGQRIAQPARGLYIVDGKKVVIK